MAKTLISLGANLGNPRQVMQHAGEMILKRFGDSQVTFSRMYRTPAVGGPVGQDDFFNAVATIESNESAFGVWQSLNAIEQSLGRQRRDRWEARRIDLDVLLHDTERHWTPTLKVPHPRMTMRTFVLEPACEVAATWIEPVTGRTIENLTQALPRMRRITSDLASKLHFLVLAESLQTNQEIAVAFHNATRDESNDIRRRSEALPPVVNDQVTISWDSNRKMTLQTVTRIDRPANKDQIERLQHQLNEQVEAFNQRDSLNLLVFAGASPDPSLVHWEDYCRGWAGLLGLMPTGEPASEVPAFRKLPKYLLSADDPKWAAHELQAAMTAMICPIQPCGAFFDV